MNPSHLFLGTIADNARDMVNKGRQNRGEAQHLAVLTEDDVRNIRTARAAGEKHSDIGKRYGVSHTTISDLLRGKTWRHVE